MVKPLPVVALLLVACGGSSSNVQIPDGGAQPGSAFDAAQPSSTGSDGGSKPDLATPPDGAVNVTSDDGFSAARTACINHINQLRATQGLAPYTIVNDSTTNMCVDAQATSDEASGQPHMAWTAAEGSACDGNGQDECEGQGTTPDGIVACLDQMWAEKDKPECADCVGCTQFGGMCGSCSSNFSACGHYVNMSSVQFTKVACGFATGGGDWAAQNFYF